MADELVSLRKNGTRKKLPKEASKQLPAGDEELESRNGFAFLRADLRISDARAGVASLPDDHPHGPPRKGGSSRG